MTSIAGAFRFSISSSLLVAVFYLGACALHAPAHVVSPPIKAAEVGELYPNSGILKGYLAPEQLPDGISLLPAPPSEGSAALAEDTAAFWSLTALPLARRLLAARDADLSYPASVSIFSCAVGVSISESDSPNLIMLLRRTMGDASLATSKAKDRYRRIRPFVALHTHTCTPKDEEFLAKNGSYPSGHASIGWAWALVLMEAYPERGDAILQRGRAYSQSRAICGVHWQSDVEAGRLIGAATVARLHADSVFKAQLNAARTEILAARARGKLPDGDCPAETQAIAASAEFAP